MVPLCSFSFARVLVRIDQETPS
uniref:Uncharacterized protein n=1 Tax=Rhizophora mucronata TaxID=61149 RepID=A0A2P2IW12_RHIMU